MASIGRTSWASTDRLVPWCSECLSVALDVPDIEAYLTAVEVEEEQTQLAVLFAKVAESN